MYENLSRKCYPNYQLCNILIEGLMEFVEFVIQKCEILQVQTVETIK
jgi:hypothetical protein